MLYMLLIHSDETRYPKLSQEELGKLMAEYEKFTVDIRGAGVFKAADRLSPTSTATTVRVRNGETLITDGPFAETKEQLGGYYLIDVKDLDEALQWATKLPTAKYGTVEVRPVWAE